MNRCDDQIYKSFIQCTDLFAMKGASSDLLVLSAPNTQKKKLDIGKA